MSLINKIVFTAVLGLNLLLSACSVEAPKLIDTLLYKGDVMQAERFFDAQIKRCWLDSSEFEVQLNQQSKPERREVVFNLSRASSEPPFFILTLMGNTASTAMVEMSEGDYSLFKRLDLAKDIERWLQLDYSC